MITKLFRKYISSLDHLLKDNDEAVKQYNLSNLYVTLIVSAFILLFPIGIAIFNTNLHDTLPGYLLAFSTVLLLYVLVQGTSLKKYVLSAYYAFFTILFLLVLYLSVLRNKTLPAATLLTFFSITPLLVLDRPYRVSIVMSLFFAAHTILAYIYKGPALANVDLLNSLISFLLGLFFSRISLRSHLLAFEGQRQLIIQKETDVLTGLYNRRKLHEIIQMIEQNKIVKPNGVLMIDLDRFKLFNDRFGHRTGDKLLTKFGLLLRGYHDQDNIYFYRYGGEEFVALIWNYSVDEINELAESIRESTQKMNEGDYEITISVGVALCDQQSEDSYSNWIDRADKAVYKAKELGRNQVYFWNKEFEVPTEA